MAKQIIWTERAQKERVELLNFWNKNNQSTVTSQQFIPEN